MGWRQRLHIRDGERTSALRTVSHKIGVKSLILAERCEIG
jgi:hypothetical protein